MFCLPSNICICSLSSVLYRLAAWKQSQPRVVQRRLIKGETVFVMCCTFFSVRNDFSRLMVRFFLGSTNATIIQTIPRLIKFSSEISLLNTHKSEILEASKRHGPPVRDFFLRNSDRLKEANETESRKCFNTIVLGEK